MKLDYEFYKLPLRFDVEELKNELSAFAEPDWQKHPSDYKGNTAIPLISVHGEINDDFAGPMMTTRFLKQSPYMQQVIASFKSVFSRSRLMRLEGRQEVPVHSDINYHWYSRVRIHVPIVTTPDVIFHCGDAQVHMAPGEAWIFDSWRMHRVVNPAGQTRVHLVIDTAGSWEFWELVGRSEIFSSEPVHQRPAPEPEFVPFQRNQITMIAMERYNVPVVMSAGEVDELVKDLIGDAISRKSNNADSLRTYIDTANRFRAGWRSIWSMHGAGKSGWAQYERLINETRQRLSIIPTLMLANNTDASQVLNARVLFAALNTKLADVYPPETGAAPAAVSSAKTGRNDPCPCGSGKKYKRCHGR